MPAMLSNLYSKAEELKGKKLIFVIAAFFLLFLLIGLIIGVISNSKLNKNELNSNPTSVDTASGQKVYYEGKVAYVNPQLYPGENISYSLIDSSGKEIFLLKSKDARLSVVEGLFVKISGKMSKLKDGKTSVLIVDEVIIKNATN